MGSTFRMPIAVGHAAASAVNELRRRGITIVATVPRQGTLLPECQLSGPVAIALGREGAGLSDALVTAADTRLTIPMRAPV